MKIPAPLALTALALLALAGCGPSPANTPAASDSHSAPQASLAALPAPTAAGQPFDFYLLNLSWSPEFCHSHSSSPECASHLGFVVHGLWPQNNDGTYPEHCPSRPGPTSDAVWQGLMPTASLAQHEWQTHGTCTPYDADTYFGLIRRAFQSVKIPAEFTSAASQTMEPPAAILDSFAQINTGFPATSFALSCGNNYLTAMEVCFDKSLKPIACTGVRSCRAKAVKIAPR
ncbi:MAG TPA: ribonuclease T2 [Acidobacteriaceae bacterium]